MYAFLGAAGHAEDRLNVVERHRPPRRKSKVFSVIFGCHSRVVCVVLTCVRAYVRKCVTFPKSIVKVEPGRQRDDQGPSEETKTEGVYLLVSLTNVEMPVTIGFCGDALYTKRHKMPTPFAKTSLSRRRRGHTFGTMCIPPHSIKDAQAKAFAASGLVKDARLNLALIPGTSFNPIGFAELPLFLTLAFVYRAQFEPKMLGPMFLFYLWKECIPMSVCLHRYFSHKGFKCGRVTQFMLYIGGCLASQVRKSTEAPIRHPEARRTPFPCGHRDAAGVQHATTALAVSAETRPRVSVIDNARARTSRTHA